MEEVVILSAGASLANYSSMHSLQMQPSLTPTVLLGRDEGNIHGVRTVGYAF